MPRPPKMKAPNIVFRYTLADALRDKVILPNPKQTKFPECDLVTANLVKRLGEEATERNKTRMFEILPEEVLGSAMLYAKEVYEKGDFKKGENKNFFTLPPSWGGNTVLFAKNERGKLTAMLPEDR